MCAKISNAIFTVFFGDIHELHFNLYGKSISYEFMSGEITLVIIAGIVTSVKINM